MIPHAMKRDTRHVPVLLQEVLAILNPSPGQTIVDCTLGLGGHSAALLSRVAPGGRIVAMDFDLANIAIARAALEQAAASVDRGKLEGGKLGGARFDLVHSNFAALPTVLEQLSIERVDGLLADLGVASPQIDDPDRGFSYRSPGPLDMRMDRSRGKPASELVNRMAEGDLAAALFELGDETDARQIASLIVRRRKNRPITTTQELMAIVCEARDFTIERGAGAKLHPASRTFLALRILVNRELANLERLLDVLPTVLKPGGIAAIISFHSGEDRRVKEAFREGKRGGVYADVSRTPVIADEAEQRANPRSRSAKLRWARRALHAG
jgi:16S rRNA (cytosine1402-N4)-methyltransferase